MHLAIYVSAPRGGGAQRRLRLLAAAFARAGHDVDFVTASACDPEADKIGPGVRLLGLGAAVSAGTWVRDRRLLWVPASLPRLVRYLRASRPDALLASSTPANLTAVAAVSLAGTRTPLVVTQNVHLASALAAAGPLAGLARRIVAAALRRADGIVAISEGVALDVRALLGRRGVPVTTIYNPIDLASVQRLAAEPPAVTLPDGGPVIVACGKLRPQKDFILLLDAFARLREQRPAHLLVLGDGHERPRLERRVVELGLEGAVRLAGYVENPFAVMARADLFVLSSRFEGFSNVLLEALACGCRIVATDCPSGPRELLADGRYGHLVRPGDPAALAAAMHAALDLPPATERQRARAAEFTVERAAAAYLAAIERARAGCPEPMQRRAGGPAADSRPSGSRS